MAQDLGYKYDYTHIKENVWNPSLYGQEFEERARLRNAAVRLAEGILEGNKSLSVTLIDLPPQRLKKIGHPQ
jgi:hypothetical protein